MKSSFSQFGISAFLSLIVLSAYPLSSFAATDSSDTWGRTTNAAKTASSWASSTNSSGQQETLPEIERLKRKMGEFLNQGMDDLQKKGYVEPQSTVRSDVVEKDGAFYLLLDLPGMRKDLINIEVKGQEISISGDRKVEDEFKTSNLIKVERRYGNFQRIFSIPEEFIADQISAKYENGVLQVRIPKKATATVVKAKTITIS